MAEYTSRDSPFPGDYQPGIDTSPGFLHTFDSAMPHFSPANSDNSYPSGGLDASRPGTSGSAPAGSAPGPNASGNAEMPMGGGVHGPGPTPLIGGGGHQHTHSTQSGHSHSFSTASLPSLASSSTSYSVPSLGEHHHHPGQQLFMTPGGVPAEYAPAMFHQQDAKPLMFAPGMAPPQQELHMSPPVGLGMGGIGMPMAGTVPPAMFNRSPSSAPPPGLGVSVSVAIT